MGFFQRQLGQILLGGLPVLRRKISRLLVIPFEVLLLLLAVPAVVVVRVLGFTTLIRFGPLRSDVIGHFVFNPEYYLCRRDSEGIKTRDFFYFETLPPANTQWASMVQRTLRLYRPVSYLHRVNEFLPGGSRHVARLLPEGHGSIDPQGLIFQSEPHIHFSAPEQERGRLLLDKMGLTDTHRYICFIVRDAAFKSQAAGRRDWSHHNYRDNDIQTFQTAAVALAEKGYWVFRMGKIVQGKLHAEHPRIIDYANSPFRDDFLDIWLTANCLYAVTTGTGLDEVCTVFRRGYVHVNQIPVGGIRSFTPSIVSFKHLKWKSSGRYLSLREQIETGLVYALHSHKYNDAGVEIVNNTSEEILAAVMEYDAWQQGTLTEHPEDRELQERFWRILEEWPAFARYHGVIRAQVSHCFLQKNHSWFLA